jgi:hypothetical protein
MCLACEEQEYFFRLWCAGFLARGEMPPGVTLEDLQALGLPPPKPTADAVGQEAVEQDSKTERAAVAHHAFVCDNPDE